MRLRVDLDRETAIALEDAALADLRPMPLQAVALLRRALGLPVPYLPLEVSGVPALAAKGPDDAE